MKKIAVSVVAFAMLFAVVLSACGEKNSAADHGNKAVNVAVGYSLKQLSLSLDSNFMAQKEHSYQDVDINGTCTELYARENGKEVSALYLQGFYRKDLKDREIMIGRQTFSAAELESNIMYQDQNIVVYDLSNFLYRDTLGARVDATGLGDAFETEIAECLGQMDTLIVKGSSKEQEPVVQPQPLIADHIQL